MQRRPPGGSWREATEGDCEYFGLRVFHPSGQPHVLPANPLQSLRAICLQISSPRGTPFLSSPRLQVAPEHAP